MLQKGTVNDRERASLMSSRQVTSCSGIGSPSPRPKRARIPLIGAKSEERTLVTRRAPVRRSRWMQSVNVPPRSIQNWCRGARCAIEVCIEARPLAGSRARRRSTVLCAEIARRAYNDVSNGQDESRRGAIFWFSNVFPGLIQASKSRNLGRWTRKNSLSRP